MNERKNERTNGERKNGERIKGQADKWMNGMDGAAEGGRNGQKEKGMNKKTRLWI